MGTDNNILLKYYIITSRARVHYAYILLLLSQYSPLRTIIIILYTPTHGFHSGPRRRHKLLPSGRRRR